MNDLASRYLWDGQEPVEPDVQHMEQLLSVFSSGVDDSGDDAGFIEHLPPHDEVPMLAPPPQSRGLSRSEHPRGLGWVVAASFIAVLGLSALSRLSADVPVPAEPSTIDRIEPEATTAHPVVAPAGPRSASEVLASVRAYYRATTDLTADFQQIYTNPVYGTKTNSRGRLRVKKPGLMVWDYAGAGAADFYVAHDRLRVVEHDLRQVVNRRGHRADFAAIPSVLLGRRNWTRGFRARRASQRLIAAYGQPGHTVIELAPKKDNPHYAAVLLVVDDATGRVDGFVVRNKDRSINQFVLSNLRRNRGLADADFVFTVPANYVEVEG